jgi:hypothetical protein
MWLLMHRHCGQLDRLRRLNLPDLCKMETVIADHQAIVDATLAAAKTMRGTAAAGGVR